MDADCSLHEQRYWQSTTSNGEEERIKRADPSCTMAKMVCTRIRCYIYVKIPSTLQVSIAMVGSIFPYRARVSALI